MQQPQGPFCQSCAMPMEKAEDFGTNADGSQSQDYCTHCFQSGELTDPDITMEQMIHKVTGIMVEEMGVPEAQARGILERFIPKLKRWQG